MPKILYSFWGHLSDKRGISSPDGNSSYSIWILGEFLNRGWEVCCVEDRDKPIVDQYGEFAFDAFSRDVRFNIYNQIRFIGLRGVAEENFDLILHEWRMKTKDNSKPLSDTTRTPDMDIQNAVITNAQQSKTPLVIFDLDYQFSEEDENLVKPHKTIEQGLYPKRNHTTVYIPFNIDELNQFPTLCINENTHLAYIGNFYNREIDFNTKILPYAQKHPGKVVLVGNYMKEALKYFRDENPGINFQDRIGFDKFRQFYSSAIAVPLLATEEYKAHGHMTARLLETLLFGSIPLGFSDFKGIETWLPDDLIVDVNNVDKDLEDKILRLRNMGIITRMELRNDLIKRIGVKHDVKNFVNEILGGTKYGSQ